jgi:hypothetical protein
MRSLAVILAATAACSVPDKEPSGPDARPPGPPDAAIDDTAPDTTITAAPAEFSREGSATFEFTSDDPDAVFTCAIDGDAPVDCESPYTRSLGDGPHTFTVRAIDDAGNSDDTPAEHVWSIDRVAPNTTITDRPPLADNSVVVEFAFESDEENVAFDCALDGGNFMPCESGDELGPLGDGAHSFSVRATDRAGNADSSPAVYAWSIDTSTPDTQLVSGPSGPTPSATATFTFLSPDAGSGATFQCSLDSAAFTTCTSPKTYTNLGMGEHDFAVRVRDAVGNLDPTPATRSWSVDTADPNTTITGGPSGTVATASASFTFTSNESPVTFECSDDGAAYAPCTSPHSLTGLAQGPHSFAVRATDAANHTDPSPATRSWTVDTVAPDVAFIVAPDPGSTTGPYVVFEFTATEGAVTCSLDGAPFAPCTSPFVRNHANGPHELQVNATDAAGNVGMAIRAWNVACGAPDATNASGLLHFDVPDQDQPNAVSGGAGATLGDDNTVEPADPDPIGGGRFGGALAFTPADVDHVAWPVALAPVAEVTLELWARPNAPAGARDIAVNSDGRIALRVTAASPTTVRFSITIIRGNGQARIATSAPVAADQWHHVLVGMEQPFVRLWVDGVRTETDMIQLGTTLPSMTAWRLGGDAGTAYDGALDAVWFATTGMTTDAEALPRYCPQ